MRSRRPAGPRSRGLLLILALFTGGCEGPGPEAESLPQPGFLDLGTEVGAGLDLSRLRWAPAEALIPIPGALPGRRLFRIPPSYVGSSGRLQLPGACPETVKLPPSASLRSLTLRGRYGPPEHRWFQDPGEAAIEFRDACDEAGSWLQQWASVAGSRPIVASGHTITGRLPAWSTLPKGGDAGVVPLSPAQLPTAIWRGTFGGGEFQRELRLDLAPRASGFPALAAGQRVLLAERDLVVVRVPEGGEAALLPGDPSTGRPTLFQPMLPGRYIFRRPDGSQLQLSSRRHDHTRMDCARAECHPRATAVFEQSAMGTIGKRGFEGELGADFDPRCAVACHGTAEPGLPDGGVLHVARELGFALPPRGAPGTWDALPRDLRRVAGIGCTPCHGPGSLPEHGASWVILRSQVCATCHDAPPRYPIVQQWKAGAMSRSDRDPATRREGCAHCHTTGGFLESLGQVPRAVAPAGQPQPGPTGIACAACHAPHREDSGDKLQRHTPLPPHLLSTAAGLSSAVRICLPCHAAAPEADPPRSSVADLFLGTPETAEVASPHAEVPGSCLGCHDGHDFSVNSAICKDCHEEAPPRDPSEDLRQEAARLLEQALPAGRGHLIGRREADPERARAYRQAGLVAADRAAGIHGAPRARALLEAARSVLDPDP